MSAPLSMKIPSTPSPCVGQSSGDIEQPPRLLVWSSMTPHCSQPPGLSRHPPASRTSERSGCDCLGSLSGLSCLANHHSLTPQITQGSLSKARQKSNVVRLTFTRSMIERCNKDNTLAPSFVRPQKRNATIRNFNYLPLSTLVKHNMCAGVSNGLHMLSPTVCFQLQPLKPLTASSAASRLIGKQPGHYPPTRRIRPRDRRQSRRRLDDQIFCESWLTGGSFITPCQI